MKISKYNFFYKSNNFENKYIAYNSLFNSLALIDEEKYVKFQEYSNKVDELDTELKKELTVGGFIINDNIDESSIIRLNMNKARFSENTLALTIAPTSDCNFRCIYCYEKDHINNSYMNSLTQENIISMLKKKSKNISNLVISWYGGEPLLAIDIIEKLSEKFIRICEENNIVYTAGIVTNGYNLTRQNLELLNKYKVKSIQITLDGDEETHNKRRPLKGGQATYNKIISNLVKGKDILPQTSIRINVDKSNMDNIYKVVDELIHNGLKDTVKPYLGHVESTNDCYSENVCLKLSKYVDLDYEFEEEIVKKGFPESVYRRYPTRVTNSCGADTLNSHVINANGDLYRCWSDLGNESKKVGNINTDVIINNNLTQFIDYDPTKDERCKDCNLLPICMGGCPIKVRDNISDRCSRSKYKLEVYLNDVADKLKRRETIVK